MTRRSAAREPDRRRTDGRSTDCFLSQAERGAAAAAADHRLCGREDGGETATFASLSLFLPLLLSQLRRVGILTAAVPSLIIVFPLLPLRLHTTGRSNGTDGGTGTLQRRGRARGYYCGRRNARRTPRKEEGEQCSERAREGGREEGQSVVINLM